MQVEDKIVIQGARVNNLRNIDLEIPANYDWEGNLNQCVITFYTENTLVPRDGILMLPTPDGTGYQYIVTGPATSISVPFQTTSATGDIRASVHSPGFNILDLVSTRGNWNFEAVSISPQPTSTNTNTPMTVSFSLPEGSVSPENPLTITFMAYNLNLSNANGLNIVSNGGQATGRRMTISNLTTTGPHTFTVLNATTNNGNNGGGGTRIIRFEATGFNNSANLR